MSDYDPTNAPISLQSASDLLKVRVRPNERPYEQIVKRANNALVDEWRERVLQKLADHRGTIQVGKVWSSWEMFIEGKGIRTFAGLRDMIVRLTKGQLRFWLSFFDELTVEEMCEYGPGVVDFGWFYVQSEVRLCVAEMKWDSVYSTTDDPAEWEKTSAHNRAIIRGEIFPFWNAEKLKENEQKCKAVLAGVARPIAQVVGEMQKRGLKSVEVSNVVKWMKHPIHANDRPYVQASFKHVNGLIDEWSETLHAKEVPLDECRAMWDSWCLFFEERGLRKFQEVCDMIPRPTDAQLRFWLDVFAKDVGTLHGYGTGNIGFGWFLLQNEIKLRVAALKAERVFVGDDLTVWTQNAAKNADLMTGNEGSFWSLEELRDNGMKVGTILSIVVAPQSTGPRV